MELIPGADRAIKRLNEAGLAVVLVTNQSGIARGLYSEADYRRVAERLDQTLNSLGARVDATYYCPHHPDHSGSCECRKPGTGLYLRASWELDVDPSASYYIGDKLSDVLPARALGGLGILVRTGYGTEVEPELPDEFLVADDVSGAVDLILRESGALQR